MPSVSPAQKRLMAAVAHGWHKPGGGGPSVAVAKEFNQADTAMSNKGYKGGVTRYAEGGPVLAPQASRFMKTEDQFRAGYHANPNAGKDKPYGKSGPNAGKGEDPPPAAKSKSSVSMPRK